VSIHCDSTAAITKIENR